MGVWGQTPPSAWSSRRRQSPGWTAAATAQPIAWQHPPGPVQRCRGCRHPRPRSPFPTRSAPAAPADDRAIAADAVASGARRPRGVCVAPAAAPAAQQPRRAMQKWGHVGAAAAAAVPATQTAAPVAPNGNGAPARCSRRGHGPPKAMALRSPPPPWSPPRAPRQACLARGGPPDATPRPPPPTAERTDEKKYTVEPASPTGGLPVHSRCRTTTTPP
eukprot:TRINITY_DN10073_c0_g1_i1.p1 TRINITY_DN10073_c0_g1~~TRINITY_DN10073_c0_g1_i1.p1  ORF type:complete len:217 (-),score=3.37 TRINITY_DN10073_c0_g1_i1:223-873(-)